MGRVILAGAFVLGAGSALASVAAYLDVPQTWTKKQIFTAPNEGDQFQSAVTEYRHETGGAVWSVVWRNMLASMPYQIGTYASARGDLATSLAVTLSNKRYDSRGEIQGVSALANGSEPSILAISPDINGPAIAVEVGTHSNHSGVAFYDLGDISGGATAYSPGYGKKKFQIGAGTMLWSPNLSDTPLLSYFAKLEPTSAGLRWRVGGTEGNDIFEITQGEAIIRGVARVNNIQASDIPTTDPGVQGRFWNDNGTCKISAGP